MAGISKIAELEARKRALVTQSEIWRETLKADIENLRLYGSSVRNRFDKILRVGPWLLLALPVAAPLLGLFLHRNKKKNGAPEPSKVKGGIATALLGFRLYRKYGPMVRNLVTHFASRRRVTEDHTPAENN
jgi:hypothetical protein